ncbi:unnamed protein product [Thelazia callipaeda]|uniref:ANK_REP_REGION domain-containing protein n=1 Tax=Thelazia callipaeda TaxID=103827 RepID=A0A0N5CLL1_THECL|nr:unnamed protein product [Thelazia callipaeda]
MSEEKNANFFAVHIPSPKIGQPSTGAVFETLKEASKFANSPDGKAKGARFKRFHSPKDALNYAKHGDYFYNSPKAVQKQHVSESCGIFPSVSRIMLSRLKRSIEAKDDETFTKMVSENPRYLINISSDTPTIVVEGFRYNALHVASKCGNFNVVEYVLNFVCDIEKLLTLYETSEENVRMRSNILLDCYLNMPDKGCHDTPLHFASKFGHYGIVRLLLSYNKCHKNAINKSGLTAAQICCSRYSGFDKKKLLSKISALFTSFFVSLYRMTDNYHSLTIRLSSEVPVLTLEPGLQSQQHMLAFETCELAACAGPFSVETVARTFYETWKLEERECRRSNPRKGAERVGRRLAQEYKVTWMERWNFSNKLIDLNSFIGLEELNRYLVNIRLRPQPSCLSHLVFDDDSDDSNENSRTQYSKDYSGVVIKDSKAVKDDNGADNASVSSLTELVENSEFAFDRTLDTGGDYVRGLANLDLNTSTSDDLDSEHQLTTDETDADAFDFDYYTPPSSPDPVYIYQGVPSKEDEELALALSMVNEQLLKNFGAVTEYLRHVRNVPETERSRWPHTDSPRAKRRRV